MKLKIVLSAMAVAVSGLTAGAAQPTGTLPVIYINTEGGVDVPSKYEPYVKATYYIDPCGCEGIEAVGTAAEPLPLQIRGRGNYTWTGFDKKPYRLKLDKKAGLLGMNKSKQWGLLAHADDTQGFMRNATGFEMSRQLGLPWTPGDQPCEVVLNGRYDGLYFLTELVKVAKDRVNVINPDDEVEEWIEAGNTADNFAWTPEMLTGGWLVEIDNYEDEDQIKVPTKQMFYGEPVDHIKVTYDTPSDYITQAHKDWLMNEFKTIDEMVFAEDKTNCRWAEKVDLTNAARFYLVNQITGNYESYHGSCKLWHERGTDAKWNFGPVWDFGSAFQDSWSMESPIWECLYIQHWVEEMCKFPAFMDEVKRLYSEFRDNGTIDKIFAYQNKLADRIDRAAKADKERWPQYGNDDVKGRTAAVQGMLRKSLSYLDRLYGYQGGGDDVEAPTNDIYLRGKFNNWGAPEEDRFTLRADGMYVLDKATLSDEFKIAGPEWNQGNVDFGGATNIKLNTPVKLTKGAGNCTVEGGTVNNVTLVFDWKRKELSICDMDAIDDVEVSDTEAPAYYNLQGVRVAQPERGGMYIRVSGDKATKIVF